MEFLVERYGDINFNEWNDFLNQCKNRHFFFNRLYMDYHKDRFIDHSLLVRDGNNQIVSIFPAVAIGEVISSHGGLSFGGLLYTNKIKQVLVHQIWDSIIAYYRDLRFREIIVKLIPHIYSSIPSDELRYVLFRSNASLFRQDVSSTISFTKPPILSKGRKWLLARGKKNNYTIKQSIDFDSFFNELNAILSAKYGVIAVHTGSEMEKLAKCFPDNIKMFTVTDGKSKILAGSIIFITDTVVHAQYILNPYLDNGAIEVLINHLLGLFEDKLFFDFGTSCEQDGRFLNEGLINFKESFGASSVTFDFYKQIL